jgi:RimJ/RimL family protein N-acetyltransferase
MKKQKSLKPLSKKTPPAKIKTERLILKKLDLKMAKAIFNAVDLNRKHLGRFLPWVQFMKNVEDESKWIEHQRQKWREKGQFVYAIFRADDETYLGNVDAHALDWNNHKAEIGYWLAKKFEGQGFMTEAVKALEGALFGIGFHRLVIQCNVKNKRSAKVPIRRSFQLEGVLKQNAIENGVYRDTMVFAKLQFGFGRVSPN